MRLWLQLREFRSCSLPKIKCRITNTNMKLNKTTVVLLAAGLLTTAVQADEKGRGPGKGRPEARGKGGERPDRGAAMAKALGLNGNRLCK